MKAHKFFHTLVLAASLVSTLPAHAGKKRDSARFGEEVGDTKIVSIHEAGAAGRLADRLIVRSNAMMDREQIPTVAKVYGDRIIYTSDARSLKKLSSLSEEVLMHLAQTGKCDKYDSDCIVFEDKKDAAYRIATTPSNDGSISVMMAIPQTWGSRDNSTRGLAERIDHTTRTRSVIYTRATSSY